MSTIFHRSLVVGIGMWLTFYSSPIPVQATVGWEIGDMVLDFGLGFRAWENKRY